MFCRTFKSILFFFSISIFITSCSTSSKIGFRLTSRYINASKIGLIPNSQDYAKHNATKVALWVNKGYGIIIDDVFYVGRSDIDVVSDFCIKGNRKGKLILTTNLAWTVARSTSIYIANITLTTNIKVTPSSQVRLIENRGCNYHPLVMIEKCAIDRIRVYSHVAEDVDQVINRDGVNEFVFIKNLVTNTAFYVVRLSNCLCETAHIEDNEISNFQSVVFGLNVTNNYRDIGFFRIKTVYFRRNKINNSGYVIDASIDYEHMYHTPIIVESEFCECKDNTISNIICTKNQPVAVYPFYINGDSVIISNNTITDCLNLSIDGNNELFKCKQSSIKGKACRIIENNICTVTSKCIEERCYYNIPCIKMCGFQMERIHSAIIHNNKINVACNFVFGSAVKCEYDYYEFSNNTITYRDIGTSAKQLLRLCPSNNEQGIIKVFENTMQSSKKVTALFALFDYNYSGYSIEIRDNYFSGALPYGSLSGSLYPLSTVNCLHNVIDIGDYTGLIRIPVYMWVNDTIKSDVPGFAIRLIGGTKTEGLIDLTFPSCEPAYISSLSDELRKVTVRETYHNGKIKNQEYMLNSLRYIPQKHEKIANVRLELPQ